jgi:hypothetical protein
MKRRSRPKATPEVEDLNPLGSDLSRADHFVTPADCVRDPYGRKLDESGNPIGEIPDTTKGRDLYDLPRYTPPPPHKA